MSIELTVKPHVIKIHMVLLQVLLQQLAGRPGRLLRDPRAPDARVSRRREMDLPRGSHGGYLPLEIR